MMDSYAVCGMVSGLYGNFIVSQTHLANSS